MQKAIRTLLMMCAVLTLVAMLTVASGCAEKQAATSDVADVPADMPDAENALAAVPSEGDRMRSQRHALLPRLLDLGSNSCVPCKMMEPVLAELERDYGDRLQVDFIDISKNSAAAETFEVRSIPTQIYFSADGTELARHEGFIPKEDILAKFAELGIDLGAAANTGGAE